MMHKQFLNKSEYQPDVAIHPGESLKEVLETLNIPQKEFSIRMGISEKHFSQILNGKAAITPETAIKLERVLGIAASFWNNLEKNYQSTLARLEANKRIEKEVEWVHNFASYSELVKCGFVPKTLDFKKRVEALLSFFQVDSLYYVDSLCQGVSYRRIRNGTENDLKSVAAWLRCGEILAEKIKVNEFDRVGLKNAIKDLRSLSHLPSNFGKKLIEICASFGLAVVYMPYFKKTKIKGAFRWVRNRPIIQLNTHGLYSDIFWFTFFHELGHLLLHGKKEDFIDVSLGVNDDKENEANIFATDHLIPSDYYKSFVQRGMFSKDQIGEFSKLVNIDPSIVAGRLAKDDYISWSNAASLRKKLVINF